MLYSQRTGRNRFGVRVFVTFAASAVPVFALAATSPPSDWLVVEINVGQNQSAHIEAYGDRLMNVEVRDRTCAAHLPKRYLSFNALPDIDSVSLRQTGSQGGSNQIVSMNVLFESNGVASAGRVEWTLRDCRFVRRVVYQVVNGSETKLFAD